MPYLFDKHVTALMLLTFSTSFAKPFGKPSVGRLARDLLPFRCDVDANDHSGLVDGINCEWDWWAHSSSDFLPQSPHGLARSASPRGSKDRLGTFFDNTCDDILLSASIMLTKCQLTSKQAKSDILQNRPELKEQYHFCQPFEEDSSLCLYTKSSELGDLLTDMRSSCHELNGEPADDSVCQKASLAFISYLSQKFGLFGNRYTFESPEKKADFIASHPECSSMNCHDSRFGFEVCNCECDCGCDTGSATDSDTDSDTDDDEDDSGIFARSSSYRRVCGPHYYDSPEEMQAWLAHHPRVRSEDIHCIGLPISNDLMCYVHCDMVDGRMKRDIFDAHVFETNEEIASFVSKHPECAEMPCTDASTTGHHICYCDESDDEEDQDNLHLPRTTSLINCDAHHFDSRREMNEWIVAHPAQAEDMTCGDLPFSNDLWCTVGCHIDTMLPKIFDLGMTVKSTKTTNSTTFVAQATGNSIKARDHAEADIDSTLVIKTIWPESTSYLTTTTESTMELIMPSHTMMGSTVVEVEQTSTSTSTTVMPTPFDSGLTITSVVWQTTHESGMTPKSTTTVSETVIAPETTPEPFSACQHDDCDCSDSDLDDQDDEVDAPCGQNEDLQPAPKEEPAGMLLGVPKEVIKSCTQQEEATACFEDSEANLFACSENDYACRCKALNQRLGCFDHCNMRGKQWRNARKLRSLNCNEASAFPPASPAKEEASTQAISSTATVTDAPAADPSTDSALAMLTPMAGVGLAAVFAVGAFLI